MEVPLLAMQRCNFLFDAIDRPEKSSYVVFLYIIKKAKGEKKDFYKKSSFLGMVLCVYVQYVRTPPRYCRCMVLLRLKQEKREKRKKKKTKVQ